MKLTMILLTAAFLNVSAKGVSQQITYSGTDVPLKTVFTEVEKQSGYFFFYDDEVLLAIAPVTVHAVNVPLSEFLEQLFKGQPISYVIKANNIIVSPLKAAPPTLFTEAAVPPPITGVVKDSTGMPLSGATVYNKRTKKTVQTNAKGEFSVEAEESDILTLSFIGFESQNIKVTGNSVFAVMRVSSSPLDEIQIRAYGTTSKRLNTGNIATVKGEDIIKQPVDNPLLALQGRVPGLIITPSSGLPGAPVKVQLRGQNSLTGLMTQPLIVIDGVPYSNNVWGSGAASAADVNFSALRLVDASNIESIDILKDADATAIYGSRGANGVILITTKKGKIGATRVNINAYTGISESSTKKIEMLNTQQYLEMRKEAYTNVGEPVPTIPSFGNYDLTVWNQERYTNWQKVFSGGSGKFSSIQTSVTGGTQTVQFVVGGTYQTQASLFAGKKKDEMGSGHFSIIGNSVNKKMRVAVNGSFTENSSNGSTDFSLEGLKLAPNAPQTYLADGVLNWEPNPLTGFGTWQNPYANLNNAIESNRNALVSSIDVSYELMKGLQAKISGGYTSIQLSGYRPVTIASQDPATWPFFRASAERSNNYSKSWSVEPQLIYTNILFKGRLDILIGGALQRQKAGRQYLAAFGYTSDIQLSNLAGATGYFSTNGSSDYKYIAGFGRVTYNWREKYIVNVNVRRDGSSRFGPGKQFGNFGSIGSAWIFSNEESIQKTLPVITFGKIRFSIGNSGNDNIADYQYMELYSSIFGAPGTYQGVRTTASQGVINPDFHWENTKKVEAGIELGLFKDKVLFTAIYFNNRSNNQLGRYPLPSTAGAFSMVINQSAAIENSGTEFTLTTTNIKRRNFTWITNGNISFFNNKLLSLPEGFTGLRKIYGYDSEGEAVSPIGKPFAGVEPVYDLVGVDEQTGLYVFATDDGKVTEPNEPFRANEFAKVVRTAPEFFGGISNSLQFKGISLDIFLQFVKQIGRNSAFDYAGGSGNGGLGNLPLKVFKNTWRKPGDAAQYMKFQAVDVNEHLFKASWSDAAWVDASFVRVKNASLSYNVNDRYKQKLGIQSLRIYVQAQNLLTFTNYHDADPETQMPFTLPPLKIITLGFQVGL